MWLQSQNFGMLCLNQHAKKKDETENDEEDFEIFVPGLFEHYAQRPYSLEDICLADFAAWFEFATHSGKKQDNSKFFAEDNEDNLENAFYENEPGVDELLNEIATGTEFKLLDNSGYIKKRKFSCILNYRRDHKDPTENARSTLLLFKPWRNENIDIHNTDFRMLFEEHEEEILQIKENMRRILLFLTNLMI